VATAKAQGKRLNAAEYCAKSAGLNSAEINLIAFMEDRSASCKIKIPVALVAETKATHAKGVKLRDKACAMAAGGN
jgi:hypothetical protein